LQWTPFCFIKKEKKMFRELLLCLFVFSVSIPFLLGQTTVHLQSAEFGRGILKPRLGECFVIAPLHVVEGGAGSVTITGARNVQSTGVFAQGFPGDLAVVRVVDGGQQACTDWETAENYDEILSNTLEGFLELRREDGSTRLMQVFIPEKTSETITIEPKRPNQSFTKGMSGAALYTLVEGKKVYLGMLQEVDSENGWGYVIQADDLERILGGFFDSADSPPPSEPSNRNTARIQSDPVKKDIPQKSPSSMVFEDLDLKYELLDIKKTGSRVVCKFKVTSLEKDTDLRLSYDNIYVYDQNGLVTQSINIAVGNKNGYNVNYQLVHNVPVSLDITFDNVASSAKGLSFFSMPFRSGGRDGRIEFRNISFDSLGAVFSLPRQEGEWSEEVLGFEFQLMEYKKSGSRVTCKFLVTNLKNDGFLRLSYDNIYMYDQNGLVTRSANVLVGSANGYNINYYLIKGVQTPLELVFDDVATSASGISYMDVKFSDDQNNGMFLIRNLSFDGFGAPFNLPAREGEWSDQILGMDFQFMEYRKVGGRVVCKFVVTNLETDGFLRLSYDNNFIYDEKGQVTQSSNVLIGNQNGYNINYYLIKDVPTPMEITFDDVATSAQGMSSLYIELRNDNNKGEIWLRNLSFEGFDTPLELPKLEGKWSTKTSGFDFQLMECDKAGTRVYCKFLVTKEDSDGFLRLSYDQVAAQDDTGSSVNAANLLIGNKSSYNLNYYLIQGVQTPLELTFENIPSSATMLTNLTMVFSSDQRKDQIVLQQLPLN
jgi:hypothetical protein